MRSILAIVLAAIIICTGCGQTVSSTTIESSTASDTASGDVEATFTIEDDGLGDGNTEFSSLSDGHLHQYIRDTVYSELEYTLESEDYRIENISTSYISKEYLDELAYNSKPNIYFGYSMDDISAQFDDGEYIFTCDENGKTVITEFEKYDDTFEQVIKNVAIGSGVILICVTVSAVSAGVGAPVVSAVFAASAKTGTIFALSSGTFSGAMKAAITGFKTKDMEQTVTAAALAASEGFKWGAVTGVVSGGISKALEIGKAAQTENLIPSPQESEQYATSIYGGEDQISYVAGKKVDWFTPGATRPDVVVKKPGGAIEAIEVKNYDLASLQNRSTLYRELKRQVTARVSNLPKGATQRIVLDTRGRDFSKELVEEVVRNIRVTLSDVYPNIPIDIL